MVTTRSKRKPKSEEAKLITAMQKASNTHTVEIEIISSIAGIQKTDLTFEHGRQIRNRTMGILSNAYEQMIRTKEYNREVDRFFYFTKTLDKTPGSEIWLKKQLQSSLEKTKSNLIAIRERFGVTEVNCAKIANEVRKKYNLGDAVLSLVMADRVWDSFNSLMFGSGERVHYYRQDEMYSISGKQASRFIIPKLDKKTGELYISFQDEKFTLKIKKDDFFIEETVANMKHYMINSEQIDKENVALHQAKMPLKSTFRIKYVRIIRKEIRGKHRYFAQFLLEGDALPKRKKDGSFRHVLGKGKGGGDVGTQSFAGVTQNEVILTNLGQRGKKKERKLFLTKRKMDRSRRATNPDLYNANGTPKADSKGKFVKSKRYKKLQVVARNLERINAENRKYANNELVNHIRTLCDELYIEDMKFKALQKKSKETTVNEKTGKQNKRKRFGKSILNRCPGGFVAQLEYRFKVTGGNVLKVNTWTFKASQYDHTIGDCNKKQLSQRSHQFLDGTKVQRDLYSAFLLMCSDLTGSKPDRAICFKEFDQFKTLHDQLIRHIKSNKISICNSGIAA